LAPDAIKDISQRLSGDLSLRLPTSLQHNLDEPVTPQRRKEYVTTLLERDPGVFLERYANKLLEQERAQFEPLRDDYEVDFYLKLAEDEAASAAAGMSATAKNRRLAQLNRLTYPIHQMPTSSRGSWPNARFIYNLLRQNCRQVHDVSCHSTGCYYTRQAMTDKHVQQLIISLISCCNAICFFACSS